MAATPVDIAELKRHFARKNLERLSSLEPPTPPDDDSRPIDPPCKIALEILQEWSKENASVLQKAIEQRAFGGKYPIQWTNAFLPFMESMGVYLRDYYKVVEAWKLYRDFTFGGSNDVGKLEAAISIYQDANYDIDVLAQGWEMDFVIVCDLVKKAPNENQDWDGPFCGVFFTTKVQDTAPFLGLAFKGTKPTRKPERRVDFNYDQLTGDKLNQTHCSKGVYTGLFGTFDPPYNEAYSYILNGTQDLAKKLPNSLGYAVNVHVTGHSLGGSYSSFCYTQLLIDVAPNATPIVIGDEYTFGSPRVGSDDYARLNGKLVSVQTGQTWRIVNNKDIVPQVPPTKIPPETPERLQFHHVDNGIMIFPDKTPLALPSEIGGPWPEPYDVKNLCDLLKAILDTSDHSTLKLSWLREVFADVYGFSAECLLQIDDLRCQSSHKVKAI